MKTTLGAIWAAPVTALPLLAVLALWALRQVEALGVQGPALEWRIRPGGWMARAFSGWGGFAAGQVVLYRPGLVPDSLRTHEHDHVRAAMRLGPLLLLTWPAVLLHIAIGHPQLHTYYDHPMELAGRRAAGQRYEIPAKDWRLTRLWPWRRR